MIAARGQKGQRPFPPLSPVRNPLPRVMFHRYNAFMPGGTQAVPAESLLCIIQWHGVAGATQGTPNSSIMMSSEPPECSREGGQEPEN